MIFTSICCFQCDPLSIRNQFNYAQIVYLTKKKTKIKSKGKQNKKQNQKVGGTIQWVKTQKNIQNKKKKYPELKANIF